MKKAGVMVMILLLLWFLNALVRDNGDLGATTTLVRSDALHSAVADLSRSFSVCTVSHVRCAVATNRNSVV